MSDRARAHEDAVLRGDVSGVSADLVPLAAFVAALRGRAASEPAPPMAEPLRAQLSAPNVVALRAARSARRVLVLAAAVLAVVALLGIGAAQNRLPGELQDVVASTVEVLGVDVPRSSERGDDRSDAGVENGRDDTAPDAPAGSGSDREPGYDELTPGGALPADPGGSGEQATPATPPAPQDDRPEKVDQVKQVPLPAPPPEAPTSDRGDGGDLEGLDDRDADLQEDDDQGDDDQGAPRPGSSSSGGGSGKAASSPAKDR